MNSKNCSNNILKSVNIYNYWILQGYYPDDYDFTSWRKAGRLLCPERRNASEMTHLPQGGHAGLCPIYASNASFWEYRGVVCQEVTCRKCQECAQYAGTSKKGLLGKLGSHGPGQINNDKNSLCEETSIGRDRLVCQGKRTHNICQFWVRLWKEGLWMMPRPRRYVVFTMEILESYAHFGSIWSNLSL